MTNKEKEVGDPNDLDGDTYRLAVSNECFATSNKVVRTNTDQRALASRGAK
jgi:hypothetical protein